MELLYTGKTKDVYKLENGNILLKFKDSMTGKDGVFDPGENQVGLTIEGAGKAGLAMTKYMFEKIAEKGIETHYIDSNLEEGTMEVLPCTIFGKGIEVVCRFRAVGSFIKRYGDYIETGEPLDAFVEITIKDDERNDPPLTKDALEVLNILTPEEYDYLTQETKKISTIIKDIFAENGLDLYDIKLEFGRRVSDNKIILIDEISGGNMRVYHNDEYVSPMNIMAYLK